MTAFTRRNLLRGGLAATSLGLAGPVAAIGSASAPASSPCADPPGPDMLGRSDRRFPSRATRGYNRRFVGRPENVWVVGTTEHVVRAVQQAVRSRRRITVRSGGHGFEGFIADPAVDVVVDMSAMSAVYYDAGRRAFAVEAGASLGETYRQLFAG